MRDYELMLIISPTLETEAEEEVLGKALKIIEGNGGAIEKSDKWGKKRLAYPIRKFEDGSYHVVKFKGEKETVAELDRVMGITDQVLRSMIVKRPSAKG